MKPQDLRIGNLVKLRDTGEIVRVCGLTKHKVGFHAPNERPNAQLRYRRLDEIEPVLIYDHHDKIDCPGLIWFPEKSEDEALLYDYYGTTVSYIHELQNLHYASTGKELKIEL